MKIFVKMIFSILHSFPLGSTFSKDLKLFQFNCHLLVLIGYL